VYLQYSDKQAATLSGKDSLQNWGAASSDGKDLAIRGPTIDSNVWMIENS